MNNIFEDGVAVVTGAGDGIGFEIAKQLVIRGANVVLNSRHEKTSAHAAAELNNIRPGSCFGIPGDSSDPLVIKKIIDTAVAQFGKITMAVANTGITVPGSFFDYTEDDFQRTIDVNLRGTYFFTQAAARQMREQDSGGGIILMSSVNGEQANKNLSAYAMTKAGIMMLAKNLVIELSAYNIRINCVAPGATLTDRTTEEKGYEDAWSDVTPLNQVATPKDIADATLFLLSRSARHITGQTLTVDGGWTVTSPAPEGGIM